MGDVTDIHKARKAKKVRCGACHRLYILMQPTDKAAFLSVCPYCDALNAVTSED